ncbi:MAG: PilZ domain-containing protein [Candidatus Caldatribacterium sp.]|uniref:flagellar brake protein n=1 Tax=Candidatus Caldatribacterium sp. TaxID=2282143 RepID=UPI0029981E4A|nr:PilZ domain-containing protein [Candidatus Caldatribacterium sp.]MCX7730578.1 PilZ domain-containing protein [Candidatus Caldatribacterium sp.]MDW8081013.1 PilZ domain-containing protein [Candidatus Calescibacterium sp.]
MEVERIFRPNRKASLGVRRRNERGELEVVYYPSRIEFVNEDTLWLAAPQERGTLVPVSPGEVLEVYIVGENEVFFFEGEVKDRVKRGSIAYVVFGMPEKIVRKQRRNYVRFEAILPVLLKKEEKAFPGTTKNISGGGMLVQLREGRDVFEPREELLFLLSLDGRDIVGRAQVVRKDGPGLYAFQFSEIADQDRESIIKYIFQKQIELRRKGLLRK